MLLSLLDQQSSDAGVPPTQHSTAGTQGIRAQASNNSSQPSARKPSVHCDPDSCSAIHCCAVLCCAVQSVVWIDLRVAQSLLLQADERREESAQSNHHLAVAAHAAARDQRARLIRPLLAVCCRQCEAARLSCFVAECVLCRCRGAGRADARWQPSAEWSAVQQRVSGSVAAGSGAEAKMGLSALLPLPDSSHRRREARSVPLLHAPAVQEKHRRQSAQHSIGHCQARLMHAWVGFLGTSHCRAAAAVDWPAMWCGAVLCCPPVSALSDFCPLDLFSCSSVRVQRAVAALLRTPQNNLRLLARSPDGTTQVQANTHQRHAAHSGTAQPAHTHWTQPLTVAALLVPVACMPGELLDWTDAEQVESVQRALCSHSPSLAVCEPSVLSAVLVSVLCSAGCCSLLRRLSALQAHYDRFDVEAVLLVYRRLLRQYQPQQLTDALWPPHTTHDTEASRSRADSHYQQQQQQAAAPHCAHRTPRRLLSTAASISAPPSAVAEWAAGLSHSASCDVVRDYLIAHSLKDCSLILDIAATQRWQQQQEAEVYSWQCGGDERLEGVYSVQVIDLDRKHVHNIPRYAQLDAEIAMHYANEFAYPDR